MKGKGKRPSVALFKRAGIVTIALLGFGLLTYAQVILPNIYASRYEHRMRTAADRLEACFNRLADTGKLKLYEAPDISLEQKSQDVSVIRAAAHKCAGELQRFNSEAQSLQGLQFSGYTPNYRSARAIQDHALNVAGQSNDVLKQYDQVAVFLERYSAELKAFVEYTTTLNNITDTTVLNRRIGQLAEQGGNLHARAAVMRTLKAPTGFEPIIQPTANMLEMAANGFDDLALGYANANDDTVTLGFHTVEKAVADYDSSVKDLPFEVLQDHYTIKQVQALPVKFNDLKSDRAY